MKNKIIVFGGSGFIGINLIEKLKTNNFEITSVSRNQIEERNLIEGVKYLRCDVGNRKDLKKINDNFDFVVNLSGNIDHKNKNETFRTHYNGCKNILKYFSKKKFKLFIQIGSSLEYGNLKSPHNEEAEAKPASHYGVAKYKATQFIKKSFKRKKFSYIILRLYQVFGPKQKLDRLIPYVISSSLKNKKFKCSSGIQSRDFIYIDDLTNLILKILKKKNYKSGIFNVGLGKPIKVINIINTILKIIKKGKPLFGKVKLRQEESLEYYPNISKIKKFYNWSPKTKIYKDLKKTIKYYEKI